ncbi:meiosis-specific protein ASY3 [Aristolochia californica]|uniref:meiosis-specific protein ASY3 n=1 Tax=Aristolochia californica TaxID=171875 RepID=UPI0035DBB8F6
MSGRNISQSSQGLKVSIGVMLQDSVNATPGLRKEDEVELPPTEKKFKSSQGKTVEEDKDVGTAEGMECGQPEPTQGPTGRFSTRSLNATLRNSVLISAKQAQILQISDISHEKVDGTRRGKKAEKSKNKETVEEFAFARDEHVTDDGIQRKTVTYGRTTGHCTDMNKVEGFAFATRHEILAPVESIGAEGTDKTTKGSNQALRMKLCEILGTNTQQSQKANSPTLETDIRHSEPETERVIRCETIKPKLNSDTIETDSESPRRTVKRPVTRSLTRNNCPTKKQTKLRPEIRHFGNLPPSLSPFKKNIFTFNAAEGQAGVSTRPVNTGPNIYKSKKSQNERSRMNPRRISYSEEKKRHLPQKTAARGSRFEDLPQSLKSPLKNLEKQKMETSSQVHKARIPLQINTELGDISPQATRKDAEQYENCSDSKPKHACSLDRTPSPTFAMDSPMASDSPRKSQPKKTLLGVSSVEERSRVRGFSNSRTSLASRSRSGEDEHAEVSDCSREIESPLRSPTIMKDKDAQQLSLSLPGDDDHDGLDEPNRIRTTGRWSSGSGTPENSPHLLYGSKKLGSLENTKLSEHSPSSPFPMGTSRSEEIGGLLGASGQSQEVGLASAIHQLALVLERFQAKMKTQKRKICSEILASLSDKIQLQLQSVESQIQMNVEKFTRLSRSKKKRLESRFEEKQERLKLIHGKFKEQVNQHLQDYQSAFEELEAFHMELKGEAERHKSSHRKLLLQAEEAIHVQLDNAEKKMAAMNKAARKKMRGLKLVLQECLNEDVLS